MRILLSASGSELPAKPSGAARVLLAVTITLFLLCVPLLAACGEADDTATQAPTAPAAVGSTETPTTQPDEPTSTATSAAEPTATDVATASPTAPASATEPATSTSAPATSTPAPDLMTLSVYFMRDEKIGTAHREVPRTQQVAAAAMRELLEGPTDQEREAGLSTSIPEGTTLNDITIQDGIATVDLSASFEAGGGSLSMAARLAQVVYTLTQFPTVDSVLFELDGEPVEVFGGEGLVLDHPVVRADYEDLTPAIFVETPAVWDTIDSSEPMRIQGTANTFEAVFQVNIVDAAGVVVYDDFAMATSGSGTRGTFDLSIPFTITRPGVGALIVFEYSMRDGSQTNLVEIPLHFE